MTMTHAKLEATPMKQSGRALARIFFPVLAAGLVAACGKPETEPADAAAEEVSIGVENVTVVQEEQLQAGPTISGSLQPENAAQVRAQTAGSVVQMLADKGQTVSRGQVLARIDDAAFSDAHISAQSAVRTAAQSLVVAQRNAERAEKLAAAGALAQRELEAARWNVSSAESQLADARARLALAQKQLAQTAIRAPMSGIVADATVNGGDVVQPGTPLFTIVDPRSMRLEGAVPSDQLAQVSVGMPVRFEVRGYPGRTFVGSVTRINPVADPMTRQVPIIVSIPNAGGQLVGGLFAEGRVTSEERTGLTIPISAVETSGTMPVVTRLKGGVIERVPVELGIRDEQGEKIEVVTGLAAGDTLVIGAARGITPGTHVRVNVVEPNARR